MKVIETLVSSVSEIRDAAQQAQQVAQEKAAESANATARIQEAQLAAEATAREARAKASSALLSTMRELTEEVRVARSTAVDAILTGSTPALEAWLRYRRTRATNKGTWNALGTQYSQITGHRAPPGDWGPDVITAFDPSRSAQVAGETFMDFLTAVVADLEAQLLADRTAAVLDLVVDAGTKAEARR
jgi:Tfp pilus assembly protein FimT